MAVLAIDFDGVIHDDANPLEGKTLGPPIEGAQAAIRLLRNEQGHKIIVFSVKPPDIIEDWLRYYDIPFDKITNIKPNADAYIDDKAVRFFNWNMLIKSLDYNLPLDKGGKRP